MSHLSKLKIKCFTCIAAVLVSIVWSILNVLIILSQHIPEVPGPLQHQMVDGLHGLADPVRRGSLQPLVQIVHQVAAGVRALEAVLYQDLVHVA